MSITSRINEMSSHIEQAYDELQGLGADLTNVNKNIENISMVLDDIYDSMPQVSGEGTSLTLDDTRVGKIKSTLKGNTSQTTYSGKNLLPEDKYITTTTKNGITYTNNGDGTFNLNGTASANTTIEIIPNGSFQLEANQSYYLYSSVPYNGTTFNMSIPMTDNGTTKFLLANNTYTPTATPTNVRLQFYIGSGQSINQTNIKLMLVKGTTAPTEYEPYVGGTASPNPNFPQPVNVVSGDNEINVCGKNLYSRDNGQYNVPVYATDGTSASYQDVNVVWIKVKPNTDYSFTLLPNSQTYFVRIIECTGDKNFIYRFPNNYQPGSGVANTLTITTRNNCEWLQIGINQYQASQISQNNWEVMIEKSSTPSTYEAYQGNTYNIDLGVKNLWNNEDIKSGFLPQSGSYPTTNSSYPNARYVLVNLIKGQSITLSGVSFSGSGRVRYIDKDTNQVVGNMTYLDSAYYIATHTFGDGFYEGTITAKKDFIVGIMDLNNDVSGLIVNYGTTPQTISPNPIELGEIGTYKDKFIRTSGKNLFDKNTITTSAYLKEDGTLLTGTGAEYVTSDFIPVKPNTTYYKTQTLSPRTKFYNADKQVLDDTTYQDISIGGNAGSFTTPNNAYYFRFTGNVNVSTGINIDLTMVNEGSSAIDFEPYGIGEWYYKEAIKKITLKGTGNTELYGNGGTSNDFWEYFRTSFEGGDGTANRTLTNYFNQTDNSRVVIIGNGTLYLRFPKNMGIDVSTNVLMNSWLSTHNTGVKYVRATPTYTKITSSNYPTLYSQLEAIYNAQGYDNQTNISQVNNDLPFIISASALKEWQESASLNSTLSMVNPLSLGNTLNTQENNIQPIEVDNIEPLEEEENEES